MADLRVSADGLALAHQDDGLAIRGNLHGAENHRLGDHFTRFPELEPGAFQPRASAVGTRVDRVRVFRKQAVGLPGEPIRLDPLEVTDFDLVSIRVGPGNVPVAGDRAGVCIADGKNITCPQDAAAVSAEHRPQIRGAAAKDFRDIDATCNRDIATQVAHAAAEIDAGAGLDFVRPARSFIRPANPCHPGVAPELQHGAGHGAFDDGGVVGIADKPVGDGGEHRVGGSPGRDAEMLATPPTVILDGTEGARLDNMDAIG